MQNFKSIIKKNLEFKISEKELEQMLIDDGFELKNHKDQDNENKEDEKINFDYLIKTVDTLKREKLFLVSLLKSINYVIFTLLMSFIILYINYFNK